MISHGLLPCLEIRLDLDGIIEHIADLLVKYTRHAKKKVTLESECQRHVWLSYDATCIWELDTLYIFSSRLSEQFAGTLGDRPDSGDTMFIARENLGVPIVVSDK